MTADEAEFLARSASASHNIAELLKGRYQGQMTKSMPIKFSVQSEDKAAAVAHLRERGYSPMRIEERGNGSVMLVFSPLPDNQMFELVQALPFHLSAKIGVVMGDHPPFHPEQSNDS